ncbi:hypothetical protein PRZ48_007312 [Zasmidium cellare]|uniref:UBA domain-containing protein n=1 Tax=Zasmidium cellare TaxID=395010 RepID=A0ABR0EL43_ZASCE|nr:hypothetical protein PRZ48_007312 [Zasmidium cellare]
MSDASASDWEMGDLETLGFEQHTAARRAKARRILDDDDESTGGEVLAHQPDSDSVKTAQEADSGKALASRETSTPATSVEGRQMMDDAGIKAQHFVMVTGTTNAEADEYLSKTNGDLQAAVRLFLMPKPANVQEQAPDAVDEDCEPKPATLLDEALAAARPKRLQKDGDLVIILDIADLSKTYRLRSEDVERASPIFKHELAAIADTTANVNGIKHLFILQAAVEDGAMPLLGRKPLDLMRGDCEDKFYKQPAGGAEVQNEEPSEQIKVEEGAAGMEAAASARSDPPKTDWINVYEIFIRAIAFPRISSGISSTDITTALEKLELVAQIAKATQAVSCVSIAVNSTFTAFMESQQLWPAIADDAVRWLLVGINLEKPLIYNEALTHVAGCFPEWPWSVPKEAIPFDVLQTIATKSLALDQTRKDIERKLMCLHTTFTEKVSPVSKSKPKSAESKPADIIRVSLDTKPLTFTVVSIFREWIALHLNHLDSGKTGPPKTKSALCDHSDPECLTIAGFHRLIGRGGDAYLPADEVCSSWDHDWHELDEDDNDKIRSTLKKLKASAAGLVAPLLASALKFEGREKLGYLTAIEVTEEDMPWDTKKVSEEGSDEDEL